MPSVVYIGPEGAKTLRDVTFPHGKAVEVSDMEFFERLTRRDDFQPAGDDIPPADPVETRVGALGSEVNLERLGLLAVAKRLSLPIAGDAGDQDIADAVMSAFQARAEARFADYEPKGEPEPLKVPEVAPGTIPADWESLQWKQRVRLAKNIAPEFEGENLSAADADEIIREKLKPV